MSEENSKRGRASRNKGAAGERELKDRLNALLGADIVKRGYVFLHQSDCVGLKNVHIECKRVEKLNVSLAYKQAVNEAQKRSDGIPCVFHRKNREPWLVTMSLEDWVKMYEKWVD